MSVSKNILIKNPVAVMTGLRGEQARAEQVDVRITEGVISEIGPNLTPKGERVIDASDGVVFPGWVNTHHHLDQSLMKAVPDGLNLNLEEWLAQITYPRVPRFTPELVRSAARLGMAELLLSGASTCADHHLLYYSGSDKSTGDVLFETADELGMRFVLCRGGALESAGDHPGFSKTSLQAETLDEMVSDLERLKAKYHQDAPDAWHRVVVAPTTPTFSIPPELLTELARAARRMGLRLNTHLSETGHYVKFCREKYDCLPVEFVAEHEWLGSDVWFAHLVKMESSEIQMLAESGAGASHCPMSNSRLGSGIAPIPQLAEAGAPISIGVDGVASNESGSMCNEVNAAWLIHRAAQGASSTVAEDIIHWGSAGGAHVLGLDKIGTLEVGQAADLVVYDLDHPRFYGFHDRALAPVVAGEPITARYNIIGGHVVVDDGVIPGLDLDKLRADARSGVKQLWEA